jgi:predicted metal-dependent peptidase
MHLACAIDTSGSMPTEALCQIWAELDRIHKNGVEITVIEADCQIHRVYKFDPKVPANVAGRGGTAYQPALDKAAELDVDGLIYFGDMDSADRPKKPKYPVLWAIYGNQKPPGNFGMSTKIEIKKKK